MKMRPAFSLLLIALAAGLHGQSAQKQNVTEFMGRKVTLTKPEYDDFGIAKASAEVCFAGQPKPQCYAFRERDRRNPPIGFNPALTQVALGKAGSALLFSATQYAGGSGGTVHLALLRPGSGDGVDGSLFPPDLTLSMQGEHAFLNDRSVSDAPIFVTADYVWGLGECHVCEHRFTVSAYVLKPPVAGFTEKFSYDRDDQYMTARRYIDGVLNSEKPKILARLKRVKAEADRQAKSPR